MATGKDNLHYNFHWLSDVDEKLANELLWFLTLLLGFFNVSKLFFFLQ